METRYVTGEDERYRLYRLCECTTCSATGKVSGLTETQTLGIAVTTVTYPQFTSRCPDCRGEGRTRELVATATDPESLGVALVTLGREGEWTDCPIGILDTEGATGQKWLVRPWQPSPRNVSDAARVLAKSKTKEKT
jgi:hypothetical protein